MKIGIDARLWNETGVGRYIRSLFTNLSKLDKKNDYIWFFRKDVYEQIELPSKKWKKVLADIRWHSLKEQIILPIIFSSEHLDLLHFPYFSFPVLYPGKFMVTIHDLIFDHYKTGKTSTLPMPFYLIKKIGYHLVLYTAIRKAKLIFTLSENSKSEIVSHYHADPKKIFVTYESGELEENISNIPSNVLQKIKNLKPFLLYVGNAHPHKNVISLLRAMRHILAKKNSWKLVLIGSDNFFYPKLKEKIKDLNLSGSVILIGDVPNSELKVWYKEALAFVTASKMEGFGIPPLEAMSLGCPVFVSNISVFHEIYQDAAVYFDQNNPENIAEVVLNTLKNQSVIIRKIELGYMQYRKYSWEKMANETLKSYNKMIL